MAGAGVGYEERRRRTVGVRVTEAEAEELRRAGASGSPLGGILSAAAGARAAGADRQRSGGWGQRSYGS